MKRLIRRNPINAQTDIPTPHHRSLQVPQQPFLNQIQTQLQNPPPKQTNKKPTLATYPEEGKRQKKKQSK